MLIKIAKFKVGGGGFLGGSPFTSRGTGYSGVSGSWGNSYFGAYCRGDQLLRNKWAGASLTIGPFLRDSFLVVQPSIAKYHDILGCPESGNISLYTRL